MKVDVDEHPDAAATYRVQSVPTFIFKDKNSVVGTLVGADNVKLVSIIKDLNDK